MKQIDQSYCEERERTQSIEFLVKCAVDRCHQRRIVKLQSSSSDDAQGWGRGDVTNDTFTHLTHSLLDGENGWQVVDGKPYCPRCFRIMVWSGQLEMRITT